MCPTRFEPSNTGLSARHCAQGENAMRRPVSFRNSNSCSVAAFGHHPPSRSTPSGFHHTWPPLPGPTTAASRLQPRLSSTDAWLHAARCTYVAPSLHGGRRRHMGPCHDQPDRACVNREPWERQPCATPSIIRPYFTRDSVRELAHDGGPETVRIANPQPCGP